MSFQVGDTVGGYRVIAILGSGGMGEVYKVEHTVTRRVEAMKVLTHGRPGATEEKQRFLREIQLQASLDHPNIAAVHNAFGANDDLVLVMELVSGESLESLLQRGRIPLAAGIKYVSQTLSALSYAHSRGVVHRDITPANIIITAQGAVKLTDFGLARQVTDPRLTQTGACMGSPYYMSPEQIRGISRPDLRTDIYSLGAVLYELATGRKPFESESAFSIMLSHVEQAPAPPAKIEPGIGRALSDVIMTAMAKDPARRFQSAEAFRKALERARPRSGLPAAARRSPLGRLPRLGRPRAMRVAAAGVVVFAAFLAILWGAMRSGAPAPGKEAARELSARPVSAPIPPKTMDRQPAPVQASPPPEMRSEASPAPAQPPAGQDSLSTPSSGRVLQTAPAELEQPKLAAADADVKKVPRRKTPLARPPKPEPPPRPEQTAQSEPAAKPAEAVIADPAEQPPQQESAAAAQAPPAPPGADSTSEKQPQKRRNRLWRALGKILPPWK